MLINSTFNLPKLLTNIALVAMICVSGTSYSAPHTISGSNFTMLDPTGGLVPGGATDVSGTFEDTLVCSAVGCTSFGMTLSSATAFLGFLWTAHDVRVFDQGTYAIDSGCTTAELQTTGCPAGSAANTGPTVTLTVGPNQLGAHMLFDWGAPDGTTSCGVLNCDIDVAVLWDFNSAFGSPIYNATDPTHTPTKVWNLVSRDGDSSGFRGIAMVDGAFPGFYANFNLDMAPPLPNPNSAPVANDDNRSTPVDTAIIIDVVDNDTDVEDGSPPPVPPAAVNADATSNQGFTITNSGTGTLTYTPTGGFAGIDNFQYTLLDSNGLASNTANVTITVTATANAAPVASDPGGLNTNEDTALNINVNTVASDGDMDALTFNTFDLSSAQGGTVTVDGPGTTLTYTPAPDYFGADSFNYQVTDGIDDSNVASLSITVNSVNDPLVCADVTLNADTNSSLDIDVANDLLSTCTDTENDPISLESTTQPTVSGSMLTFDGLNTLTYTPATDFNGQDTFTYTATDGIDFDTRTVKIDVGLDFGNFTMLDSNGDVFGGTNDVLFDWDGTFNTVETDTNFNMSIASNAPWPFNGFVWTAHHVRVFGPGTYSFDTGCTVAEIQATGCPAGSAAVTGPPITMTVAANQVGVHILFDWNVSSNIDVVNVWNQDDVWDTLGNAFPKNALWTGATGPSPDPATTWALVSTDVNGDNINGAPMVDGPFQGFYANFNASPGATLPPPPPYSGTAPDTKLGSGLFASPMNPWVLIVVFMTLIGVRRFNKNQY